MFDSRFPGLLRIDEAPLSQGHRLDTIKAFREVCRRCDGLRACIAPGGRSKMRVLLFYQDPDRGLPLNIPLFHEDGATEIRYAPSDVDDIVRCVMSGRVPESRKEWCRRNWQKDEENEREQRKGLFMEGIRKDAEDYLKHRQESRSSPRGGKHRTAIVDGRKGSD